MPTFLNSLFDPALNVATEITYQTSTSYLGRIFNARFYDEGGSRWFVNEPGVFNKVISAAFTADTPESTIDKTLVRVAESFKNGLMLWDVEPSLNSTMLKESLSAHGWVKSGEVRSMVLDLHALKVPAKTPSELTIELVESEEAFKEHIDIMSTGFGFPEPMARYLSNLNYGQTFLHDPNVYYYVGRVQGEPVTISLVLLCEGIAGIYNVATIPQARHQGFGTAITVVALQQALDLGYRIAAIQASEMGAPIYRALGFQDHFMFDSYALVKEGSAQ
ncbi:GNAT family N-acetyltransferase [Dictyobacter aurantiacus]|uniref:N-acetyltransferase domain-containing protein n=1 Tax=Dictyobacter aurantiacus TaxID=1936993 RepID=A0A401ZT82_9CHLR|nr:GNAT family N-acetyltransferase [Dictyobacter aurantiacus]GCE10099.1 hypothetical protein KDAU_74280 [Dictyobacter aurantiacus]